MQTATYIKCLPLNKKDFLFCFNLWGKRHEVQHVTCGVWAPYAKDIRSGVTAFLRDCIFFFWINCAFDFLEHARQACIPSQFFCINTRTVFQSHLYKCFCHFKLYISFEIRVRNCLIYEPSSPIIIIITTTTKHHYYYCYYYHHLHLAASVKLATYIYIFLIIALG